MDPSKRRSGKNAPAVFYSDITSSIAPVPDVADRSVPAPPERSQLSEESSKSEDEVNREEDCDIIDTVVAGMNPYYPNQRDLNDLIKDLGLTKSNGELLISRLNEWNLLNDSVQVTSQKQTSQTFLQLLCRGGQAMLLQ